MINVNTTLLKAYSNPEVANAILVLAKHASEKSNKESTDKTGFDETTQNVESQRQQTQKNNGVATDLSPQSATGEITADPNVTATSAPADPMAQQPQQSQQSGNTLSPQITQSSANGSTPTNAGSDPDGDDDDALPGQAGAVPGTAPVTAPQSPYEVAAQVAQSFIGEEVYNAASQGHPAAISLIAETAAKLGAAIAAQASASAPAMPADPVVDGGVDGSDPMAAAGTDPALAAPAAGAPGAGAPPPNQIPQSAPRSPAEIAADQIVPDQPPAGGQPQPQKAENEGPKNPSKPEVKDGARTV